MGRQEEGQTHSTERMQLLAALRSATSYRGWHTREAKREQCNSGKVSALQSCCTTKSAQTPRRRGHDVFPSVQVGSRIRVLAAGGTHLHPVSPPHRHAIRTGTFPTLCIKSLVRVHLVGEGMAQGDGREKHLHADDEVLIPSSDRAFTHRHIGRVDFGDGTTLLQDGQQHPYTKQQPHVNVRKP